MSFNGAVLKWARKRKGISAGEAAERIGIPKIRLLKYEKKVISIPMDIIRKMAEIYETDMTIFFLNNIPVDHRPKLRCDPHFSASELISIMARRSMETDDSVKYPYPLKVFDEKEPLDIAMYIQNFFGITRADSDSKILEKILNKVGNFFDIFYFTIDPEAVEGIAMPLTPRPIIGINSAFTDPHKISKIILHEFVHLLLLDPSFCMPLSPIIRPDDDTESLVTNVTDMILD